MKKKKPVIVTDCDGVLLQWLAHTPSFVDDIGLDSKHLREIMDGNKFIPFYDVFCAKNETEAKDRLIQYNNSHYMKFLPIIEEKSVSIIKKLSKKYDIIVVTNFSENIKAQKNRMENLELHYGDSISELICLDPEADKTETLEMLNKTRDVKIWIDDQIKHVLCGQKAGIKSFQFSFNMTCGRNTGEVNEISSWKGVEKFLKNENKKKIKNI